MLRPKKLPTDTYMVRVAIINQFGVPGLMSVNLEH